MKKPIVMGMVALGLSLALHCAKPNQPEERPYFVKTPMPDRNAELIALSLSGELLAPLGLYERIHQDLEQICHRSTSHFGIFCHITHEPKFGGLPMLVFNVEHEMLTQLGQDKYHAWDKLNKQYQMVWYLGIGASPHDVVVIFFEGRRHLGIMTQEYLALPGFIERVTYPPSYSSSNIYPRMTQDTISYLFRNVETDCTSGVKWSQFWFIVSADDSVTFVDYWVPAWDDFQFPDWWEDAGQNWFDYYGYPFRGIE